MATVELRPGDTLNIVWSSTQETPLGVREVESSFAFSYDELLQKLRAKGKAGKSRKSGTDGARYSRIVALAVNALRKGRWSTGAEIDRDEVFERLVSRFEVLDSTEYGNITENAKKSLKQLYEAQTSLNKDQLSVLAKILQKIRS